LPAPSLARACIPLHAASPNHPLQPTTTVELLSSYKSRETLNTSLWRIQDAQTQALAGLEADVRALQEAETRLAHREMSQFDRDDNALDEFAETHFEDLDVITSELEPVIKELVGPVERIFDMLDCSDTDQLSPYDLQTGVTMESIADYMHAIDVRVRELQLRAKKLCTHCGEDVSQAIDNFAAAIDLVKPPETLPYRKLRSEVLQQVARIETLLHN